MIGESAIGFDLSLYKEESLMSRTAKSLRDMIDPSLWTGFDMIPKYPFALETLVALRSDFDAVAAQMPPVDAPSVDREEVRLSGFGGGPDVPAVLYRPRAPGLQRSAAILQIHGGGYVTGSPLLNDQRNRATVQREGCLILSVDYRLAPETRAPGAVHDCYAGLCWLRDRSDELMIDVTRLGVWGESAGGGLAAALTLFARDQGGPRIAFQYLSQPMLDDRTCARTDLPSYVHDLPWSLSNNAFGWRSLLGVEPGSSGVSPYAAPARAATLKDLPAAFIVVGALDLFVFETLDYAQRLVLAGVPVELHVYPGCFHGFDVVGSAFGAQISLDCIRDGEAALHRALSAE